MNEKIIEKLDLINHLANSIEKLSSTPQDFELHRLAINDFAAVIKDRIEYIKGEILE